MLGKHHTAETKQKWKYPRTEETKQKMSKSSKLTIEKIQLKYRFFSQIEKMRYNPGTTNEKEIQVHCKYRNCINSKERGGWFTPTYSQLGERIRALEKQEGFRENNFYCSEQCKNQCPLYRSRGSLHQTKKPYTQEEYQTFRQFVLNRDDYECQFCGEKATHVHHEKPQKLESFFALDPDYAWSCCKKCHCKYGHKTGTQCSTGNLASKIC
jgi:5-methylcytosine-specific restriction endonuclease McrA